MSESSYQVLARKWRPRQFGDVVGQKHIVQTLVNALDQGRIAHAYCFSGIRGVGKTTIARLLAKGLNCRAAERPISEPCGTCESCVEIEESRSLDVVELDAASQTGVDNIRELTEVTRYAPSRDRHRVFIIDEAHMLSTAAFNALLKTLEEPPPHVIFMLATTEPNKILPTVLSRCQHYHFGRITQQEIIAHLARMAAVEQLTVSADSLALVATAADGSLRDAQSLLDKLIAFAGTQIDEATVVDLLGLVDRVLLFRVTDLLAAQDLPGVLGFVNEMVDTGVDLHQFTVDLLGHLRDLLVVRTVAAPGDILHLPEDDIARLRQQAEAFDVDDLDRAFSLVAASEYRIKTAAQPRYHLEVVLARLARMPRLEPIENLIAALGGQAPEPGSGSRGGRSRSAARESSSPTSPSPAADAMPLKPETATATPAPDVPRTVPEPAAPSDEPPPPAEEPPELRIVRPPEPGERATPPPPVEPPRTEPAPAPEAAPPSAMLQRIQEHVNDLNPLLAPILGRTSGISLRGETIVFQFPGSTAIFAERLRDAASLTMLGDAASAVLGRPAVARVEIDPNATRGNMPAPAASRPESRDPSATAVAPGRPAQSGERDGSPDPASDEPSLAQAPETDSLRQRAESEPRVQEFVKALRGQITSVEEL